MNARGLARALGIERDEFDEFEAALEELQGKGELTRVGSRRFAAPTACNTRAGRIVILRSGRGVFDADDPSIGSVEVSARALNGAMHGDRVEVALRSRNAKISRPTGRRGDLGICPTGDRESSVVAGRDLRAG